MRFARFSLSHASPTSIEPLPQLLVACTHPCFISQTGEAPSHFTSTHDPYTQVRDTPSTHILSPASHSSSGPQPKAKDAKPAASIPTIICALNFISSSISFISRPGLTIWLFPAICPSPSPKAEPFDIRNAITLSRPQNFIDFVRFNQLWISICHAAGD